MDNVVIFGAGGHASVVADIIRTCTQYNIIAYIASDIKTTSRDGLPIIEDSIFYKNPMVNKGIIAIGNNFIREKVVNSIHSQIPGFEFITCIHPKAYVSSSVNIGVGTVVMAHATINPYSRIGAHCIVNTNSSIDHDSILSDFASIAPNSVLGGNCSVGKGSAICIGACMEHKSSIGDYSILGAMSFLRKNLPDKILAYGTPAKIVRNRAENEKYL